MTKKLTDEELAKISGGADKSATDVPVRDPSSDTGGGSGPIANQPDADGAGSDPGNLNQT